MMSFFEVDITCFGEVRIGPSEVRALPLAAGINVCGHYFGPSGVHALPLAAGLNVGGHQFRYILVSSVCVRHRRLSDTMVPL